MKKHFLLGIVVVLFYSCNKRYTQQSPEIDTYKKVIEAYQKQDWNTMATYYAYNAKILNNVTEKDAQTVAQLIEQNKEDAKLFSSWKYDPESVEYERVITDKGEMWVNFWGHWEGQLKTNGKQYVIPTHITSQFVDGKIVREDGYWDISKLMMDILAINANEDSQTE